MNIKEFIRNRGVSLYISAAALVSGIVAIILYVATGITSFTPKLDGGLIAALAVGIALNVVSLVVGEKLLKYACYIAYLFAWLQYIYVEITYIANIFVSIDGTQFTAEFIFTFIFCLLAAILSFVSAIFARDYIARERVNKA